MFILEFSKLLINYLLIIDNDYFRNNQIVLIMSDTLNLKEYPMIILELDYNVYVYFGKYLAATYTGM